MTQALITIIKDASVALPKAWKGARVFVRVTGSTATITKIPSTKTIFAKAEIKTLRKLGKRIAKTTVSKALKASR